MTSTISTRDKQRLDEVVRNHGLSPVWPWIGEGRARGPSTHYRRRFPRREDGVGAISSGRKLGLDLGRDGAHVGAARRVAASAQPSPCPSPPCRRRIARPRRRSARRPRRRTALAACSFAGCRSRRARRPPGRGVCRPRTASIDSRRCLIMRSMIATMSVSLTSTRSSTSFCLIAASSRRIVDRRAAALARIASFMSSVMRALSVIAVSQKQNAALTGASRRFNAAS